MPSHDFVKIKTFLRRFSSLSLIITLDWPTSTVHRKKPERDYFFFIAHLKLRIVAKIRVVAQRLGPLFTYRCARDLDQRQPWSTDDTSSLTCWLYCFNSENSEERFKIRDQHSHMSRAKLQSERRNEQKKTRAACCTSINVGKGEKKQHDARVFGAKSTGEAGNGNVSKRMLVSIV